MRFRRCPFVQRNDASGIDVQSDSIASLRPVFVLPSTTSPPRWGRSHRISRRYPSEGGARQPRAKYTVTTRRRQAKCAPRPALGALLSWLPGGTGLDGQELLMTVIAEFPWRSCLGRPSGKVDTTIKILRSDWSKIPRINEPQ